MPRESQMPRIDARSRAMLSPQKGSLRHGSGGQQTPRISSDTLTKIPLNDDKQEKSMRFQSRQALHEAQLNQIKAAASPMRKRRSLGIGDGSPRTPSQGDDALTVVGGNAVTPMKRVPILANFEEWMKMATDNKINATNSWNFALIDYFHDMSLLREGDSVNFQKASCTLDGCVKIYTSRVDSVATETGKLLSGLADSGGNKKGKGDNDEGEVGQEGDDMDDDEEGEDGVRKRTRKRVQRSSETTLATSFAQLQLKKMELEFSVDPLFKKASADFDEGGAKGLLLNHLTIDAHGRIVFDSSDDAPNMAVQAPEGNEDPPREDGDDVPTPDGTADHEQGSGIDVGALGLRFFPDLVRLDEQDICPSLKTFELGAASDALDIPFLKAPDDWRKDASLTKGEELDEAALDQDPAPGFDDDDDDGVGGGFDVMVDVGFGDGGEAWAKEAAMDTQPRPYSNPDQDDDVDGDESDKDAQAIGGYEPGSTKYGVHLSKDRDFDRENILSYFDQALQKNWAGPQHWRIQKIKDATKSAGPTTRRKEKEPFLIDFAAPMTQATADLIYTPAASNSAISLPRSQWRSKTRNLLPDDKHFSSKQLLSLFLKPKARIGSRKPADSSTPHKADPLPEGELDEAYWARAQGLAAAANEDEAPEGNYDANFFQNDGLRVSGGGGDDDDDFADARETFSPGADGAGQQPFTQGSIDIMIVGDSPQDGFGSQLVTQSRRLRPEYVQYARVAKKVDVRRLKEEMWKGIAMNETPIPQTETVPDAMPATKGDDVLRFTTVMNGLQSVYPRQAMDDISTSFCFICLLHLANEKGLILEHDSTFEEISIQKDPMAVIDAPSD